MTLMNESIKMNRSTLVFCQCKNSDSIPEDVKQTVCNALNKSSIEFNSVDDLCGLAANQDEWFGKLKNDQKHTIVACTERAVKWLFHLAGSEMPEKTTVLNMREMNADAILQSLNIEKPCSSCLQDQAEIKPEMDVTWIPWFPVIDYDRCTHCKQCLNFCLFRVFELDEKENVIVRNPSNCKTSCPACARVCPERAIIFPKHESSQINGSDIQPNEVKQETNLNILLQGDLQDILRKRTAGAKGNYPTMQDIALAQEERKKCGCEPSSPVQIGLMGNMNPVKKAPSSNKGDINSSG